CWVPVVLLGLPGSGKLFFDNLVAVQDYSCNLLRWLRGRKTVKPLEQEALEAREGSFTPPCDPITRSEVVWTIPCLGGVRRRGRDECGQATKGMWGMSWRQKAMKGVEDCDKPGGTVKRVLIPGFPSEPRELKHLSTWRKR